MGRSRSDCGEGEAEKRGQIALSLGPKRKRGYGRGGEKGDEHRQLAGVRGKKCSGGGGKRDEKTKKSILQTAWAKGRTQNRAVLLSRGRDSQNVCRTEGGSTAARKNQKAGLLIRAKKYTMLMRELHRDVTYARCGDRWGLFGIAVNVRSGRKGGPSGQSGVAKKIKKRGERKGRPRRSLRRCRHDRL